MRNNLEKTFLDNKKNIQFWMLFTSCIGVNYIKAICISYKMAEMLVKKIS
jgi:hypothetical protein